MKMNFPGGPVFKTLPSNVEGTGLTPGQGTNRINIVNKFNKNLKNGPHQKKKVLKKMNQNNCV